MEKSEFRLIIRSNSYSCQPSVLSAGPATPILPPSSSSTSRRHKSPAYLLLHLVKTPVHPWAPRMQKSLCVCFGVDEPTKGSVNNSPRLPNESDNQTKVPRRCGTTYFKFLSVVAKTTAALDSWALVIHAYKVKSVPVRRIF